MEFKRFAHYSQTYENDSNWKTSKQFKTVKSLLLNKQVNNVIIATDAGREGELVARLILDKVGNKSQFNVCGLVQLLKSNSTRF